MLVLTGGNVAVANMWPLSPTLSTWGSRELYSATLCTQVSSSIKQDSKGIHLLEHLAPGSQTLAH